MGAFASESESFRPLSFRVPPLLDVQTLLAGLLGSDSNRSFHHAHGLLSRGTITPISGLSVA